MNFPQEGLDYMTDMPGWFAVNNGDADLSGTDVLNVSRRMTTMRDAGQWVHIDLPLQSGLYATLILNSLVGSGVEVRSVVASYTHTLLTHCWSALHAVVRRNMSLHTALVHMSCEPELSVLLSARASKLILFQKMAFFNSGKTFPPFTSAP